MFICVTVIYEGLVTRTNNVCVTLFLMYNTHMFINKDKLKEIYQSNNVSELCRVLQMSKPKLYRLLEKNDIPKKTVAENIVVRDGWVQDSTPPEPIEREEKYTGDLDYDIEDHGIQEGESEDQYFNRMNKKLLQRQEKERLEKKDPQIKGLSKEDSDKVKEIAKRFKKG